MYSIIGQISYPVFLAGVFVFFILASIFSFIVGVGLATRNPRMMRFFAFMNTRVSSRRLLKPLTSPHYIEPTLLKRPRMLGIGIMLGAIASILLLKDVDAFVFQPIYSDAFPDQTAAILGSYTRRFLLVGNALCIGLGVMLLYFPERLAAIGRYTDRWLTFRKQTRGLNEPFIEVDKWVMANATVAGVTLSVVSLGLGIWMYMRL